MRRQSLIYFLMELYNEGAHYSTLNGYRAALSLILNNLRFNNDREDLSRVCIVFVHPYLVIISLGIRL